MTLQRVHVQPQERTDQADVERLCRAFFQECSLFKHRADRREPQNVMKKVHGRGESRTKEESTARYADGGRQATQDRHSPTLWYLRNPTSQVFYSSSLSAYRPAYLATVLLLEDRLLYRCFLWPSCPSLAFKGDRYVSRFHIQQ